MITNHRSHSQEYVGIIIGSTVLWIANIVVDQITAD